MSHSGCRLRFSASPNAFDRLRAALRHREEFRFAGDAWADENRGRRRKPPKRERQHRSRRRIEPLHVINRNQQRRSAALTGSWNTANAIALSSGADPSISSSSKAAASARRCGLGNRPKPLRQHRAQEIGEGGKREGRLGCRRAAREDGKTMLPRLHHGRDEECRLPDPRLAVQHKALGRSRPAAKKSASTATSTSRPTTTPRSRPAHSSPGERPRATRTAARSASSRQGTPGWLRRRRLGLEADNGGTRRLRALICRAPRARSGSVRIVNGECLEFAGAHSSGS